MCSLREVAHSDAYLAHHLWVLVFPIVWATLSEKKEQQVPFRNSAHVVQLSPSPECGPCTSSLACCPVCSCRHGSPVVLRPVYDKLQCAALDACGKAHRSPKPQAKAAAKATDPLTAWMFSSLCPCPQATCRKFFDSLCPSREQLSVPLGHLVQLAPPHKRAVPASCVLAPATALLFSLLSTSSVQVALAKPIITLLSKEYHARQMHQRPNVVQVGACVLGMRRCGLDLEGCTAKCWASTTSATGRW